MILFINKYKKSLNLILSIYLMVFFFIGSSRVNLRTAELLDQYAIFEINFFDSPCNNFSFNFKFSKKNNYSTEIQLSIKKYDLYSTISDASFQNKLKYSIKKYLLQSITNASLVYSISINPRSPPLHPKKSYLVIPTQKSQK